MEKNNEKKIKKTWRQEDSEAASFPQDWSHLGRINISQMKWMLKNEGLLKDAQDTKRREG